MNKRHQSKKEQNDRAGFLLNRTDTRDVKLHQAENAWVPSCKKTNQDSSSEIEARDALKRSVQSLLNKLTFQKFKTLLGHLKKLSICTETELILVVDLIYENAVHEPHFSAVYANLCKHLEKLKICTDAKPNEEVDFATILLTKCQNQFEEHCHSLDPQVNLAKNDGIDLPESVCDISSKKELEIPNDIVPNEGYKNKKRRLGNIKFIGELFKLNMILKPVLQECIEILLLKQDEESLECLCLLINTVGKDLDSHVNDSENKEIHEYFVQIQNLIDENLTSTRIRCLLKDVLDFKTNNWIPRRVENTPRTIDEIHKEAALEARKQWRWYQNMMYITAHSKNQTESGHACNGACSCEGDQLTSFKDKKKDPQSSSQADSNLEEARKMLTAQGGKSVKKKSKRKPKNKRND